MCTLLSSLKIDVKGRDRERAMAPKHSKREQNYAHAKIIPTIESLKRESERETIPKKSIIWIIIARVCVCVLHLISIQTTSSFSILIMHLFWFFFVIRIRFCLSCFFCCLNANIRATFFLFPPSQNDIIFTAFVIRLSMVGIFYTFLGESCFYITFIPLNAIYISPCEILVVFSRTKRPSFIKKKTKIRYKHLLVKLFSIYVYLVVFCCCCCVVRNDLCTDQLICSSLFGVSKSKIVQITDDGGNNVHMFRSKWCHFAILV